MLSSLIFALTYLLSIAVSLHLDIEAKTNPEPVCIRDFVTADQLVVVNIKTNGRVGDGQQLDLRIVDSLGNEHRRKNDIAGLHKAAFTSHHSAAFDICFTNKLENKWSKHVVSRSIELDIESGAAARDWNALQASEKLAPVEVELRRVQELTAEIENELQYLKAREERMRDTNESTNARVKWFSMLIVFSLVSLGVWQIQYLRHYFKVKHII